jgi:hypothetical protein
MLVCDFCVHRNDDEAYSCHDCYKWSNFVQDFSVPAQKENVAAQAYKNCAVKNDQEKHRISLFPPQAMMEILSVLEHGAQKYGDHNWAKGMNQTRMSDACFRHLNAWQSGEDLDPESGLHHIAHAICSLVFLLHYNQTKTGIDNRFFKT